MSAVMMEPDEFPLIDLRAPALKGLLVVLLGLLLAGWLLLRSDAAAGVAALDLEAPLQRVPADAIRQALAPSIDSAVFAVDLAGAKAALEQLPWVARARVERVWPATLRVRVWERTAVARWGDAQLLDTQAHAFTPPPADLDEALPRLAGRRGTEQEVHDTFQRLAARLAGSAFALAGLAQDARGEWTGMTAAGVALRFGRGAPDERVGVLLGAVAPALGERRAGIAHVDLRYTNGFTVGWSSSDDSGMTRQPDEPEREPPMAPDRGAGHG